MRKPPSPEFVIDISKSPFTCLPAELPIGDLIDCTTINSAWRVYLDTSTGEVHDCLVYYNRYLQLLALPSER